MVFNSIPFAVFFLTLFALFFLAPLKLRRYVLLLASVVFYLYSGLENLPFILLALFTAYLASRKMGALYKKMEGEIQEKKPDSKEKTQLMQAYKKKCKKYLIPAISFIVFMLILSKTGTMLAKAVKEYAGGRDIIKVIVPLGISYYTFSLVGYLLDVYWRKTKYVSDIVLLALGVFWFPQILQGPISKYSQLIPQFEKPARFDWDRITSGLQLMLWGFFKKLVIADRLNIMMTGILKDGGSLSKLPAYILAFGLFISAMQLYADFSACMDIASGVSEIFGIRLPRNFEQPFLSRSIAEFWRRWHVTLGTWFKDYVYLPISTSPRLVRIMARVKKKVNARVGMIVGTIIPLMAVWLLTGLWHGTGWDYILWGLYYGTIISLKTIFAPEIKKLNAALHINTEAASWRAFQTVRTTALFCIGRLIVVPDTLAETGAGLKKLFSLSGWIAQGQPLVSYGLDEAGLFFALAGIVLMLLMDKWRESGSVREKLKAQNIGFRYMIYWAAIFIIIFWGIYGPGYERIEFVYMNF